MTRGVRVGLLWLAFVAAAPIQHARAQPQARRIALVALDGELERAVRTALEPWRVTFVVVAEPSPGPTAPRANQAARELALRHEAAAAVWLSEHQHGYALWIYDVASNHAVSRRLTIPPPFDPPAAAAVALSLKTLLRHSASAPEGERYGEADRRADSEGVRQLPSPPQGDAARAAERPASSTSREFEATPRSAAQRAGRPPAQQRSSAAQHAGRPPAQERSGAARAPRAPPSRFDVEATAGLRYNLTARAREPRFGAITTWWPAAWAGVSARAAVGPPLAVDHADFRGDLRATTVGLAARFRAELPGGVRLSTAAGAAGEITVLQLSARADPSLTEDKVRVAPALTLELGADVALTAWLRAGLRAVGALLVYPQRYEVAGETVLELTYWTVEGMLVLGVCWPS